MTTLLKKLDMQAVYDHYLVRQAAHVKLRNRFHAKDVDEFANLALGISDAAGNYSASEHALGPRILSKSNSSKIFDLATKIEACSSSHHLPELIYQNQLPFLKISIGSEIGMMLKPDVFWLGNVRTIWTHLLLKHKGSQQLANAELALYRDDDRDSAMYYSIWRDLYLALEQSLLTIGKLASDAANDVGVKPGQFRFMWPDAVASHLYDQFANAGAKVTS